MIDPNEKIRWVELVEYDPAWQEMFSSAAHEIRSILGNNCIAIHHIGSTAIPDICAKPIVDILPVVKNIQTVDTLNSQFEALGYVCQGEYGIPGRRFYWKTKEKRTHHIHLFEAGSTEISRHVAFKDFMIANKAYANAYSEIKKNLAAVFSNDIENYVNGKASFVQMIDYKTGNPKATQLEARDEIIIYPYNPAWDKLAVAEIQTIKTIVNLPFISIDHFGSTAVPSLSSKPIIDIIIVLKSLNEADKWISGLSTMGYVFWDENPDKSHLRFFKGMPPFGAQRTHHVHIVDESNIQYAQRILFRDILRSNEKIRSDYEKLKFTLADSFSGDREAYTDQKGDFVKQVLGIEKDKEK